MDKILFEKIIDLNNKINILKKIQEDIGTTSYKHLNWCCYNSNKECPVLSDFQKDVIRGILNKHDMMIREEI